MYHLHAPASESRGSAAADYNFGTGQRRWGRQSYDRNVRALAVRSAQQVIVT